MQELQTALQEARTEQQREELRQRLKRLEEEQRQMLADADEVRQRMNRPENQSELSNQREQVDQARDALQQAADAAAQGTVAQALASGTRAQRQLQQARDEIRQQNSSQFADDLREMRGEARELSRRQDQLQQQISGASGNQPPRKTLSDAGADSQLADQVAQQRERWNRLLDRARQVSEQAETSEPLVSRELYDSVRKTAQDDAASVSELQQELAGSGQLTFELQDRLAEAGRSADTGKALDLTREMLRLGNTDAAGRSAGRAGVQIEELRRGVERAAESVLGDDTEQLKLARSELESLSDELRREMAGNGQPSQPGTPPLGQQAASGEQQRGAGERAGDPQRSAGLRPTDREAQDDNNAPNRRTDRQGQPSTDTQKASPSERVAGGQPPPRGQGAQNGGGQRSGQPGGNGQGGERVTVDSLLNGGRQDGSGGGGAVRADGPLTGERFGPWTDRLRDVEQLLDTPELRDAVAAARERARALRRDYTQSRTKPDWAVVQLQVVKPLVEVRDRVAEELARRGNRESLAPIDHDPVPNRFAESVRRYYEELGKDGSAPSAPRDTP